MKAKEKITLLMKGLSMKDITSLEEQEAREAAEEQQEEKPAEPVKATEPETDYKKLYEDLLKKDKEEKPSEPETDYKKLYEEEAAKVTRLQQQNVNRNLKNEEENEKSVEDILISAYSHS